MLANYTLRKQSVTSGDTTSSAAINLCISFSNTDTMGHTEGLIPLQATCVSPVLKGVEAHPSIRPNAPWRRHSGQRGEDGCWHNRVRSNANPHEVLEFLKTVNYTSSCYNFNFFWHAEQPSASTEKGFVTGLTQRGLMEVPRYCAM